MKRFCVIGVGSFGYHVACALYENGQEVVAIDLDPEKVQRVKDHCSIAVQGDASGKDFLAAQGMEEMEAVVVCTGERSHLSTLVTMFLKELDVKKILTKAINEDHGKILVKVGATEVIYPEKDMAIKIARALSHPNIMDFIPLAEEHQIIEAAAPKEFIGKDLITLDLRRKNRVTVIAIKDVLTDKLIAPPSPDHVIKDSEILILLGQAEDIEDAMKI